MNNEKMMEKMLDEIKHMKAQIRRLGECHNNFVHYSVEKHDGWTNELILVRKKLLRAIRTWRHSTTL